MKMYLEGREHFSTVKGWRLLIETGKILLLKYSNHYLLPKGKEDRNFYGQKFKKGRVWGKRFIQGMIKEN